jgi:hypothetical protein
MGRTQAAFHALEEVIEFRACKLKTNEFRLCFFDFETAIEAERKLLRLLEERKANSVLH